MGAPGGGAAEGVINPELRPSTDGAQAEVRHERFEVAIVVKQRNAAYDAAGGNDGVDGFADGDAGVAQETVVVRCLEGEGFAAKIHDEEGTQQGLRGGEVLAVGEALEHFDED